MLYRDWSVCFVFSLPTVARIELLLVWPGVIESLSFGGPEVVVLGTFDVVFWFEAVYGLVDKQSHGTRLIWPPIMVGGSAAPKLWAGWLCQLGASTSVASTGQVGSQRFQRPKTDVGCMFVHIGGHQCRGHKVWDLEIPRL